MMSFFAVGLMATLMDLLPKLFGAAIGVLIGWLWGKLQAGRDWRKKEFNSSIVLSLNVIDLYDAPGEGKSVGSLKLRTLFEREISHVLPNQAMRREVKQAMERAKESGPILRFPEQDSWFMLNTILNQIAEQCAVGTLKSDMGVEVRKAWYIFCWTYEHEERMHQFKPRVLMMDKEKFLAFPAQGEIDLETHKHSVRVETLRSLRLDYDKNPHLFMSIELAL